MRSLQWLATIALAGFAAFANAQVTVVPINGGTGSLVSIPIPGGNGLSMTVGTGSAAQPLENLYNNPSATQVNLGDDETINVPLPFTFSLFGQFFTNSWMHSNGVVSFQDPNITGSFCCSGMDLTTLTDTRYNYAIMPLWTDLINVSGSQYHRTTGNSATYGWYNVSEFYNPQSLNSFEVNINSTGVINTRLGGVMISADRLVTSGMTGNLAAGEYFQYHHGYGLQINPGNPVSWLATDGTGTGNICLIDPLSSLTCPGYQQAYLTQQCTISALWDPTCPGYQQAYLTQQCSINPLYSSVCPGYESAYFDRQCSINTLYNVNCPGYASAYLKEQCTINPLYSTTCDGYEIAYFNQQCIKDSLYSNRCEGYNTAYAIKYLVGLSPAITSAVNAALTDQVETQRNDPANTSGTVNAVSSNTPSASTSATSVSPVAIISTIKPAAPQSEPAKESKESKESKDNKKSDNSSTQSARPDDSKPADKPKTAREALVEKQREKTKAEAVAKGKELANTVGKAADMAAQVEIQNVIVQAMGYTPGFDTYNRAIIPDGRMYKPYEAYPGQRNIDTPTGRGLFGGSDSVHQQMIDSQYNLGK